MPTVVRSFGWETDVFLPTDDPYLEQPPDSWLGLDHTNHANVFGGHLGLICTARPMPLLTRHAQARRALSQHLDVPAVL
jgi:hypothetical protein